MKVPHWNKICKWYTVRVVYLLLVIGTFTGMLFSLQVMFQIRNVPHQSHEPTVTLKSGQVLILDWTGLFGDRTFLTNNKVNNACPYLKDGHCRITSDKTDLERSHAVLFHWGDMKAGKGFLPKDKRLGQKWVLITSESPANTYADVVSGLLSNIDWTMTYRLDSEVNLPNGEMKRRTHVKEEPVVLEPSEEEFRQKQLVVWMVSHCKAASNRDEFVKEMQKTIPVDIFGSCGRPVPYCPLKKEQTACYAKLAQHYKFYLSFENSLCKDYVSEKFFLSLASGIVPVALSGADYTKFVAKGSYINALDFATPEHLAKHLQEVGSNFTLYKRYLQWHKDFYMGKNFELQYKICDLCARLQSEDLQRTYNSQKYSNFTDWWFHQGACWSWSLDWRKKHTKV